MSFTLLTLLTGTDGQYFHYIIDFKYVVNYLGVFCQFYLAGLRKIAMSFVTIYLLLRTVKMISKILKCFLADIHYNRKNVFSKN